MILTQRWLREAICPAACAVMLSLTGCADIADQVHNRVQRMMPRESPFIRPSDAAYHRVPIALCDNYSQPTESMARIQINLLVLKQAGVTTLRIGIRWDDIEKRPGVYDWRGLDEFVRVAADENGMALIPYVCGTPGWNASPAAGGIWKSPPADMAAFGRFMTALVSRYKSQIQSWEIWNGPDSRDFWSGSAACYAQLVKAASEAARTADPKTVIVLGGIADTDYLQTLLEEHQVGRDVDVVNLRGLGETAWPMEQLPRQVARVRQLIDRYGNGQAVWVTQIDYKTRRQGVSDAADFPPRDSGVHASGDPRLQFIKMLTLLLSTQRVSLIGWCENERDTVSSAGGDDESLRPRGLLTSQYDSKPALAAMEFLNVSFGQSSRCLDQEMVVFDATGPYEFHGFELEDGTVWLLGWIPAACGATPPETAAGVEPHKTIVHVSLPLELARSGTLYHSLDADRPFTSIERCRGGAYARYIPLFDGRITMIQLKNVRGRGRLTYPPLLYPMGPALPLAGSGLGASAP